MKIPFLDLNAQYNAIKAEIDGAIQDVITKKAFIGNEGNSFVKEFENNFTNFIGTDHCIGCANGTDAIEIALASLGIGPGDEVIVPANSWISTSEAVSSVGAKPIFVDIDPKLFTIDTSKIHDKISPNTKAIIPVHLYGLPVNMDEILKISKAFNIKIIEDCAQAHGAKFHGKNVGTFGDAATFSFYPGKNLGAYGDAGAMVTNNNATAEQMKMIRNHGQLKKHGHQREGRNSRLDGIQAAILDIKLKYLSSWNNERNRVALTYTDLIDSSIIETPTSPDEYYHVYHLYVVKVEKRNELIQYLGNNDIQTGIHYPVPLPFLSAYQHYSYVESDFPNATLNKDKILSLPLFPEMTADQINYVVNNLHSFYK